MAPSRDESEVTEGESAFGLLDSREVLRTLHPDGDVSSVIDSPIKPPWRSLTIAEFLLLKLPPRELILAPWLPTKGLAMIHSVRGIGKTHLALGIAYAVATGGVLLGWSAPRPRKVLYLDGEMPATTMQRRLAAVVVGSPSEPPSPDHLRLLCADMTDFGLPDLATQAGQTAIDAEIEDAELIVIDNLSALVRSGKENEAESWLPVQSWALAHRRAGRSILFIHHSGKGGLQRGTSRREDVLDTVIALRRPDDYRADQGARFDLHFEKARGFHGDDARSFEARYEERVQAAIRTRIEIADADLKRVADALGDGMSIRDVATELGMHRSKVNRLKQKAREQGLLDG
jgi:putative DNA primase/helicase